MITCKLRHYGFWFFILFILLGMPGCRGGGAAYGNKMLASETSESLSGKIIEGKTTKDELRAILGSPNTATLDQEKGSELWVYTWSNSSRDFIDYVPVVNWFGSSRSRVSKRLQVIFDLRGGERNIVRRYTMTDADNAYRTGILK